MAFINDCNISDGKADERATFREEWLRQFQFLPKDRQEKINRDPMGQEADALFESVRGSVSGA
jgi:hypothetical protein